MSNIQKTLDSLQPYVIGIRYVEGTPVVDVVFKEGWSVPPDNNVKMAKGDESMNYYMLFSESQNIGLDDLLGYVDKVIKLNLEREKKHELLKIKVGELKEVFKKTPLAKLNRLKFTFSEEELVPNLNDFDIDIDEELPPIIHNEEIFEEETIEETIPTQQNINNPNQYLDENGNPIELTEDEREILEEEARAERNRKAIRGKQKPSVLNKTQNKVELPPKRKPEMVMHESYDTDCDCGPDEACDKCIDSKGL
jgi:hypothetical protein